MKNTTKTKDIDFSCRENKEVAHSFLKTLDLCAVQSELLQEGIVYELYTSREVTSHFRNTTDAIRCIVSFQQYKDGENIAVAKAYRPFRKNTNSKLKGE